MGQPSVYKLDPMRGFSNHSESATMDACLTQQGTKLVGTGAVGAAEGISVALSGDGNTAIVGGPGDKLRRPVPLRRRYQVRVGLHPKRRRLDPTGRQAGLGAR
jgi:hypothetical protein